MRTADTLKTGHRIGSGSVKVTYKTFMTASLVYLMIPVIIFFLGYLKLFPGIAFTLLTILAAVWTIRGMHTGNDGTIKDDGRYSIEISYPRLAGMILMTVAFIYLGGIGEFGWGTTDHFMRYAILNDLVEYDWPVIYDFSTQSNPAVASALGEGQAAFSYYFVYWMVPAVAGKIAGLTFARVVLFIWSAAGLFLVATGAMMLYGKASRSLFAGLMLFAGFDVFPYALKLASGQWATWEKWADEIIVCGNFYQIMNVFNQCIPGWLITVMLLMGMSGRSVGLLGSFMFCYSPWAAIGILPMCICKIITPCPSRWWRNLLTPGNLIAPVVFFVCFAPFYTANAAATGEAGFIWEFYPSVLTLIKDYILYVIVEFGIWTLMIRRKVGKDPMFWTAFITLLVIPVYKITTANDFLMRGSMAPLFMISLYAVMFVTDNFEICRQKDNRQIRPRLVVLALVIAAYTSVNFMLLAGLSSAQMHILGDYEYDTSRDVGSFGNIVKEEHLPVIKTQFYVYDYEDTLFFRYLAK